MHVGGAEVVFFLFFFCVCPADGIVATFKVPLQHVWWCKMLLEDNDFMKEYMLVVLCLYTSLFVVYENKLHNRFLFTELCGYSLADAKDLATEVVLLGTWLSQLH